MRQDFFSPEERREIIENILSDKLPKEDIINLYTNHREINTYLYNKSLEEFSNPSIEKTQQKKLKH